MKKGFCLLIVAAFATTLSAETDHRKQKPVISVTYQPTGYPVYSAFTGKRINPCLEIYRDGVVRVVRWGGDESTKRVGAIELEKLKAYLKRIDWTAIKAKSVAGEFPVCTDCAYVRVTINDSQLKVSVNAEGVPKTFGPFVPEYDLLMDAITRIYRAANESPDGYAMPSLGRRSLHEQFVSTRARMENPELVDLSEYLERGRIFELQLDEVGDETFAVELGKESPDVIAAVGGFLNEQSLKPYSRTRTLIESTPKVAFTARSMTLEEQKQKQALEMEAEERLKKQ